jgi:hypothetical protein
VKDVGEPCAGEPHARFDGEGLETEQELPRQPLTQPTSIREPCTKGNRTCDVRMLALQIGLFNGSWVVLGCSRKIGSSP